MKYTFTEKFGYGCGNLLSVEELLDPANGFVQDDCINVSMDVNVLKTTGVPKNVSNHWRLEKLMKKKCQETLDKEYLSHSDSDDGDDSDDESQDGDDDDDGDDSSES